MLPPPGPSDPKPKWLRKLEQESWQAELIISGAAIFGSLQLPALIEAAEHYCLLNYDRDTLFICYIAILYWRILAFGLIGIFIFHFIVRALWIGMVGLNSVYPGGFQPNEMFSPHFQRELRDEYGDVDASIRRLDRLGSGIFGFCFGVGGVFLNFGLLGVLFIFLHRWLIGLGFSPGDVLLVICVLLAPLLVLSLISMIMHGKQFRDTPFARRWQWPIAKFVSRLTYPMARRYITTSTNLVTSYYASKKSFLLYFIAGMLVVIVGGIFTTLQSDNTRYFIDEVYHRMGNDSTRILDEYSGTGEYEGIYFRPLLRAGRPPGPTGLSFWVPLPERELRLLERGCAVPEVDADLESQLRRARERERILECARSYIDIELNGRAVTDYVLKREYIETAAGSQFGVYVFVPAPPLRPGDNLIGVRTQYPHPESGEPRQTYVPFFYTGPAS